MTETIIDLGTENGVPRRRITFSYPNEGSLLSTAQSHFTKEEKKIAKLNHKNNKK